MDFPQLLERTGRARWGLLLVSLLGACDAPAGLVELDWQFIDTRGSGSLETTCAVPASRDGKNMSVAMRVRLTVAHFDETCPDPPNQPECIVAQETFPCDRRRGTLDNVPAIDEPYMMMVDVLVDPGPGEAGWVPPSTCLSTPGPRLRRVEGGRITDLAVYQVVIHALDLSGGTAGRYDLDAC